MKRTFIVEVNIRATVEIDQKVIKQGLLPDNPILGKATEAEVIEHLMFNLVGNYIDLSQIDGYANLPDKLASVRERDMLVDHVEEVK